MSHNSALKISPPPPQNLHTSPTNQAFFQLPNHPKIKPIIQKKLRDEIYLSELHLRGHLKRFSKNPKAFGSVPEIFRKQPTRYVKRLFKLLKAQGSFSKLQYFLPKRPAFEAIYLFSKLRRPSLVKTLKLHTYEFNIFMMNRLAKALPHMKNLAHFSLTLNKLDSKDKYCLHRIFSRLFRLKKLTELSIDLTSCSLEPMRTILEQMTRFTQLRSLQLSLSSSSFLIMNLVEISKLVKLTRIDIAFSNMEVYGSEMMRIFKSFKNLKELSEISLNLARCRCPKTDYEPLSAALACLENPSLIKKLSIASYESLTDDEIYPIAQGLKRFTSLKFLSFLLPFDSLDITNYGISQLGSSLEHLVSLSSLCFHFPFVARNAPDVGNMIKPLKNLTALELHFGGFYSPEVMPIQQFATGLRALKALKLLKIDFRQQNCLSNEGIESLSESLQELICLKDLSLKFGSVAVLTDSKVKSLSSGLRKLENLSDLCLNFGVNDKIEAKAVDKIAETLQFLPKLYSVTFGFKSKEQNQGKICERLFEVLKERKQIRQVTLYLIHTQFNEEEGNKLRKCRSFGSFVNSLAHL